MACAGQKASHSLHAMHLSLPEGYLQSACSPQKRSDSDAFPVG